MNNSGPYSEGRNAYFGGEKSSHDNPYQTGTNSFELWKLGYFDALRDTMTVNCFNN